MTAHFYDEFNHNQRRAIEVLASLPKGRTPWHTAIFEAFHVESSVYAIRELLANLVTAFRDDRVECCRLLGFVLLTVMQMKNYLPAEINDFVANGGQPFRIVEEIKTIPIGPLWISQAGFFMIGETAATIWIDDKLGRYLRLGNGQIFACSSTDLTNLPPIDRMNLRAYLTGIID